MKAIEAIRLLTEERDNVNPHLSGGEELVKAYDLAIEALETRKLGEELASVVVSYLMNPQSEDLEINHTTKGE